MAAPSWSTSACPSSPTRRHITPTRPHDRGSDFSMRVAGRPRSRTGPDQGGAGQSRERRPPIGGPLGPARPTRRRTADFLPTEFRGVGLLEQRPPVQEVRLAHRKGLIRSGRLAMGDPSALGLMVHRHVHEVASRAYRLRQPADRGPLVTRPASEIQDHVRSKPQRLQGKREEPPFQHIALPVHLRRTEQRNHPLIRRQPKRIVLLGQLPSPCGLSGPRQADCQKQHGHTRIVHGNHVEDNCFLCRDRQDRAAAPGSG